MKECLGLSVMPSKSVSRSYDLGTSKLCSGKPGTIPRGGDIWMPATVDRAEPGAERSNFVLYGHLRPGFDVRPAEAELGGLAKQLSSCEARAGSDHARPGLLATTG
jgi:hypothetical protein